MLFSENLAGQSMSRNSFVALDITLIRWGHFNSIACIISLIWGIIKCLGSRRSWSRTCNAQSQGTDKWCYYKRQRYFCFRSTVAPSNVSLCGIYNRNWSLKDCCTRIPHHKKKYKDEFSLFTSDALDAIGLTHGGLVLFALLCGGDMMRGSLDVVRQLLTD